MILKDNEWALSSGNWKVTCSLGRLSHRLQPHGSGMSATGTQAPDILTHTPKVLTFLSLGQNTSSIYLGSRLGSAHPDGKERLQGRCEVAGHIAVTVRKPKKRVSTCLRVTVAVTNITTKQQVGEEMVYSADTSTALFINEGSQDRNSNGAGTGR